MQLWGQGLLGWGGEDHPVRELSGVRSPGAGESPEHRVSLSFRAFPPSQGTEALAGGRRSFCAGKPEGGVGEEGRVFWEVENVMLALPHQGGS